MQDKVMQHGQVMLDGKLFLDCSSALDYLLDLWGSSSAQECRDAEEYIGTLYRDKDDS